MRVVGVILAALYARGLEGRPWEPPVRAWPNVEAVLRRAGASLEAAPRVLGEAGFWCEAACLQVPGLLARAEALLEAGEVVTAACPSYPSRWLSVLGAAAPPCLWAWGVVPSFGGFVGSDASCASGALGSFGVSGVSGSFGLGSSELSVSVVGSRRLLRPARAFAMGVGAEAARLGLVVVSGGAVGADRLAVRACAELGGASLEVWPCGLRAEAFRPASEASCVLSVAAPLERFSAALAMERNALLYAASPLAVVADCRLKEGGSWHGAVGALRRRLCRVAVRVASQGAPRLACSSSGLASSSFGSEGSSLGSEGSSFRPASASVGLASCSVGSVSSPVGSEPPASGLEALVALGAFRLEHPELLADAFAAALASPAWAQQSLFGVA